MNNVFPPDVYESMTANFPQASLYHPILHKDALRPDGTTTRTMLEFFDEEFSQLTNQQRLIWSAIRDVLYHDRVRQAIFLHFADEINSRIATNQTDLKLDGASWRDVEAYPRPGLYRDEAGYQITPHPDTPLKIVTVQFYLPRDSSQLRLGTSLYRRRSLAARTIAPWRGRFKEMVTIPFAPNSGYGFAVTRDSWHGRPPIRRADGDRHSILLFYLRQNVRLKY
jgi:hypothetical protein